jgi:iron(III) transport system permease protein
MSAFSFPRSLPWRSPWSWASVACLALLVVFLLYPLLRVLLGSFGASGKSGWAIVAADPKYWEAIRNTLVLGAAVTVTSLSLGVPRG